MADIKKPRVTFDEEGITASKPAPALGGAGAPSALDSGAGGAADPDFGLMKQDLSKLDVSTLTPLTPEIISRQATINIGTIGHVAHGKSTVVRSISGVKVSSPSQMPGSFFLRTLPAGVCFKLPVMRPGRCIQLHQLLVAV